MHRSDFFAFSISPGADFFISQYIESLFDRWGLDEVYLGNVDLCFSALVQLLKDIPPSGTIRLQVTLENDMLNFVVYGMENEMLRRFSRHYALDDLADGQNKAVFLMKKLSDEMRVNKGSLLLKFNLRALPGDKPSEKNHFIHITS